MNTIIKVGVVGMVAAVVSATAVADGRVGNDNVAAERAKSSENGAALPSLSGLFGVKFAEKIPARESNGECEGFCAEFFAPDKQFLGFTDYVKFATPETRQVFRIQASQSVMPGESTNVIARALRTIEFRFDVKAVAKEGLDKMLVFADDDFILISYRQNRVIIEAVNNKLIEVAKVEAEKVALARSNAAKARLEKDFEALQLVQSTETVGSNVKERSVKSVFGRRFGVVMTDAANAAKLHDGSSYAEFAPGKFLGTSHCAVYGSACTRRIYRVRVLWTSNADRTKLAEICSAIELQLKSKMEECGEDYRGLKYGNLYIALVRDPVRGRIVLDFTDANEYARHLESSATLPECADWRDVEAL